MIQPAPDPETFSNDDASLQAGSVRWNPSVVGSTSGRLAPSKDVIRTPLGRTDSWKSFLSNDGLSLNNLDGECLQVQFENASVLIGDLKDILVCIQFDA